MINIKFLEHEFISPILVASGTFGYGHEVTDLVDVNQLGGIVTKSVTLNPREGNPPPRIAETSSGMLNSIGLANVGVKSFCRKKIPFLNNLKTNVIINIAGSKIEDYIETLDTIETVGGKHIGYEINISCPNVKEGGMAFGVDPKVAGKLTAEMRKRTKKKLIIKLSPNVTKIEDIAKASVDNGADALSAINTVVGMSIDIRTKKPKLFTNQGGLSGPAIKPIAIANVHKIFRAVDVPIIGIGGISNASDIVEFILAGADLVQIGTMNFKYPSIGVKLSDELEALCKELRVSNLSELKGQIQYW
jgi:dihydroorotate dehydrogenase (NAD+) catalytic subunit